MPIHGQQGGGRNRKTRFPFYLCTVPQYCVVLCCPVPYCTTQRTHCTHTERRGPDPWATHPESASVPPMELGFPAPWATCMSRVAHLPPHTYITNTYRAYNTSRWANNECSDGGTNCPPRVTIQRSASCIVLYSMIPAPRMPP